MTRHRDGNRLTLLRNGTEFFPALEAAIDAAAREIFLETYIFATDATGQRIAAALARAAARGVAVHVLIDGFGSREYLAQGLGGRLRGGGVAALVYRPDLARMRLRRWRLRRLHRKLAVIDARVAFIGGINLLDDEHLPGDPAPRLDFAVRIEGPLLADIVPEARRLWRLVARTQLRRRPSGAEPVPVVAAACGDERAAFLVRDNLRHRGDIEDAYLAAIRAARTEIVIACAYFFPGRGFRRALREAARRGVRVSLLLQGRVEYVLQHYATRALYGDLLASGVRIHEYARSYLHAKVAVIDGRWATVGSSNIDPLSFVLAREANVVVEDEGFAAALRSALDTAFATGARELSPADWRRERLPARLMTWACYGIVRLIAGMTGYARMEEFR